MSSKNSYIIKVVVRATAILLLLQNNNISICAYHVDTHNVAKRMVDPDLCIGRYDVHVDTIIRTKESLKLKAVFLDETEVLNNQDCANLCCETENCDVFIYEEKVKGTCFLFQCGPPEDFRCKFTRHANYTSAVMSPMRQPEQQTPPPVLRPAIPQAAPHAGLTVHEMELVSLKSGKGLRGDETMPGNFTQSKNATPVETTTVKNGGCSRFQFACHSGECLAVYNACDGIPQCEDGSDEGPECPAGQKQLPGVQQAGQNGQQMQDLSNAMRLLPSDGANAGNAAPQTTMQRQYQIHNREDPMTAPKQWPQINPMFLDGDSRIFNHKGRLQAPGSGLSAGGYQMVGPQDAFMRPQIDPYSRGQGQQQQQQSWLPDHYGVKMQGNPMDWPQSPGDQPLVVQQSPAILAPPAPQMPQPPQITSGQVELQQQRPDWPIMPLMPMQSAKAHSDENAKKPQRAESKIKTTNDSEEISGNEYQDESDDELEARTTTAAPRKKNRKHKKPKESAKDKAAKVKEGDKPLHEQLKMIHNDLEMEFVDHDGEAERPGGAVLSLTLGIIVMAALAILVGCRMRVVGRRIRRGGKSQYAHDADFLVNGMYL
ncbi:uncharacterized protein LOC132262904 [Phlebotomus argentipes]|uniref:uncharacterized protein LOC132262904 n=1 Tax=Phlebotomus argentipes TaxID=94469 RepID=UPI002892F913|nr:uncharacterized protein LOC132262904 [Phlebotomus argentipes]